MNIRLPGSACMGLALAALVAGCGATNSIDPLDPPATRAGTVAAVAPSKTLPRGAKAAVPEVEDCTNVSVGSPTKYACGGKVYTAYQLTLLREHREPQAKN